MTKDGVHSKPIIASCIQRMGRLFMSINSKSLLIGEKAKFNTISITTLKK